MTNVEANPAPAVGEGELNPPPPAGSGPAAPRGASLGPLVLGTLLLLAGVIGLLTSVDVFGRFAAALVPLVVFGGIAGACIAAYRSEPARRWGFLLPAGICASIGVTSSASMLHLLPGFLFPVVFFAGPALAFAAIYSLDTERTWALISGWSCFVLGVTVGVESLGRFGNALAPTLFFGGVAVVFVWHYLRSGKPWALFPAGFLVTIGLVALVSEINLPDRLNAMVFFLGASATFALYYLLGDPQKARWAAWPALVLAGMGVLALVSGPLLKIGLPVLLIGFGLFLIIRSQRAPGGDGSAPPAGT